MTCVTFLSRAVGPYYSPDSNLIEKAYSKLKGASARSRRENPLRSLGQDYADRRNRARHAVHLDPFRRHRALETAGRNRVSCILRHLPAEIFANGIRGHWAVENENHWVRDVTLAEDASRIRVNPGAMGHLRSQALNIARANGVENIPQALWSSALDPAVTLSYRSQ